MESTLYLKRRNKRTKLYFSPLPFFVLTSSRLYRNSNYTMASALAFNENDGFIDGILRGYYSGILNSTQYLNFTQCETLEGNSRQFDFFFTIVIIKQSLFSIRSSSSIGCN
jgi:hypothetical protein